MALRRTEVHLLRWHLYFIFTAVPKPLRFGVSSPTGGIKNLSKI